MAPTVDIEEIFGTERAAISLQWTQEIHQGLLVSYHISVVPVVDATLTMSGNTRAILTLVFLILTSRGRLLPGILAILTLPYNAPYNVSVVADFCGQRNSTTLIELNYSKRNISE